MSYARDHGIVSSRPEALLQSAQGLLGGDAQIRELSWPHGESEVWLLTGVPRGAVLKVHTRTRKFSQELAAYRDWLPQLATAEGAVGADGAEVPGLLRVWGGERALLLSLLPGEPMSRHGVSRQQALQTHQRAGAFLRQLHEVPHQSQDPLSLADAFAKRLEAWSGRARHLVSPGVVPEVERRVTAVLPDLHSYRRVPCHRDFTPRNWLVDRGKPGYLGVIDFEHARPDLWLVDLVRLWSGEWHGRPDLRDAFLQGYGVTLDAGQVAVLNGLSALEGLATIAWAREHGDLEFEARGRAVLSRLGVQE